MRGFKSKCGQALFVMAALCAVSPAWAATGGVDTPLGQADLPLMVQGDALINLHNDGLGNVYSTFNNTANFNGITNVNAMLNVNGGINLHSAFTINEGWNQALTINSNQIWKSDTSADPNVYMQWGVAGNVDIGHGLWTQGALTNYANYGGSPQIFANGDNHTGGGISIADDGGFFDYNDAWITYNGSTGLRIAGNNGPGSYGRLVVTGRMSTNNLSPDDLPANWTGGVRAVDVYANGTIAVGPGGGGLSVYMNNAGIGLPNNNAIYFSDGSTTHTANVTANAGGYFTRNDGLERTNLGAHGACFLTHVQVSNGTESCTVDCHVYNSGGTWYLDRQAWYGSGGTACASPTYYSQACEASCIN